MNFELLGGDSTCLQPAVHSLRPVRIVDDIAAHYTPSSLCADEDSSAPVVQAEYRTWCESILSGCMAIGGSPTAGEETDAPAPPRNVWVDILDGEQFPTSAGMAKVTTGSQAMKHIVERLHQLCRVLDSPEGAADRVDHGIR